MKKEVTENKERLLPIEGAFNVRELGGYAASEGKTVKWGMAIRSGDLNGLTDADLDYLNRLQVRTYIDFRNPDEAAALPDRKPASADRAFSLPIDAGNMMTLQGLTIDDGEKIMEEIYRLLVRYAQKEYEAFFRILADESCAPVLFHCSAGKDRTGLAAALLLAALGVDRKTILDDYLLSAAYLKEKYAEDVKALPRMKPLMTVKPSYLEAAFDTIDNEYGGMENYLTRYLNADLPTLKRIYTE